MELSSEIRGACAVLRLEFPPVDSLNLTLRRALYKELSDALAAPGIRAVALAARGKIFSAGADLDELALGTAFSFPSFQRDIIPAIHKSSKPVVAAIQGLALGGGFELAMACHGCVGAGARAGLPETKIGLLHAGGGTQLQGAAGLFEIQ